MVVSGEELAASSWLCYGIEGLVGWKKRGEGGRIRRRGRMTKLSFPKRKIVPFLVHLSSSKKVSLRERDKVSFRRLFLFLEFGQIVGKIGIELPRKKGKKSGKSGGLIYVRT